MLKNMYDIDRKTASKLMKVSVRTVDRYIVVKKLSIEKRDGRIWLDKKEVLRMRANARVDSGRGVIDGEMSMDKRVKNVGGGFLGSVDMLSTSEEGSGDGNENTFRVVTRRGELSSSENEEKVFKKLFEELRQELKEKQERLEGANYRVGQLEGLLKDSVPLPDHQKLLLAERSEIEKLKQAIEPLEYQSRHLETVLKDERLNKRVYLILLFILMLLQPLWLFFSLK